MTVSPSENMMKLVDNQFKLKTFCELKPLSELFNQKTIPVTVTDFLNVFEFLVLLISLIWQV